MASFNDDHVCIRMYVQCGASAQWTDPGPLAWAAIPTSRLKIRRRLSMPQLQLQRTMEHHKSGNRGWKGARKPGSCLPTCCLVPWIRTSSEAL